jgi:hypothetical protein
MHLLLIGMAMAQSEPDAFPSPPDSYQTLMTRDFLMESNMRFRQLWVPDKFIDVWFYDSDDPGANPFKRPSIQAYVVGFEFNMKTRPKNWIIYAEYMGSLVGDGYWDDVEQGTSAEHEDGDWVRPDNFGGWFFGSNYAHEFNLTPATKDVWLSLLVGGGLGVGVIQGDLAYWRPGSNAISDQNCYPDAPAYVRKNDCQPDGVKSFPRVLPMVDVTLSARINFADRGSIRLDGGIHDLLYAGGAVGVVF